ncbi:MAG: 50S ribosomal protein L14e [Candidatus Altiarchaeota archaeon]|nr:50S ribosomal protein L14e [Candidatus Altiarchaeota archaeon]
MLKKGRVCLKIAGRDAGHVCVIEKAGEKLMISGPGVRNKLVNPSHLEPLPEKLALTKLKKSEIEKKLNEIELALSKAKPDKLAVIQENARARAAKEI